jgi:hypothetical protein
MIGHAHDEPLEEFRDPPQCPPCPDAARFENCRVVNDRCQKCGGELGDTFLVRGHDRGYCVVCTLALKPEPFTPLVGTGAP